MTRLHLQVEAALEALEGVGDVSVQSELLPDDHFDRLIQNYGELSSQARELAGRVEIRHHDTRSADLEDYLS